jgi:hypothetical protein
VIRTAVLSVIALGVLATPALALEVQSVPAPHAAGGSNFNGAKLLGMMPAVASEAFRFGPSDQAQPKGPTVIYELKSGKPAEQIDVTNARDNPFMPQPERPARPAH